MCLAVIDFQPTRTVPVRIVANRDEFRERPTKPMHWWGDDRLLAGQDLQAGGTWMGIDSRRRFALLTNIRPGYIGVQGRKSRGDLVVDYLSGNESIPDFHARLRDSLSAYGGFNLLLGNASQIFWFSSAHPQGQWLTPGIHALSNDALNTPWPKTELARRQMQEQGCAIDQGQVNHGILASTAVAEEHRLPDTGVPIEWETRLSAQTITGDGYGTLARTHLALSQTQARIIEQQIDVDGQPKSDVGFLF
jgi:uncharacterized protein with NRDE domain